MKDHEFLELLNLYLDHEISAADAARLESEVQSRPERRATYLEYCRMQKACTMLSKDFASEPADRKVVDFESSRPAWASGTFAAVGGLAVAAACVALVLVNRAPSANNVVVPAASTVIAAAPQAAPEKSAAAVETPVSVPSAAVENSSKGAIASTVSVPARRTEVKPMFAVAPLAQTVVNADTVALIAAAQQNAQAQFEWMKSVQLAPLQSLPQGGLRLDARSPLQPAGRTYTDERAVQGTVEQAAFRFQR